MFEVMFFNKFNRLVFAKNRYGEYLSPTGELVGEKFDFPEDVTFFDDYDSAVSFAESTIDRYGADLRATVLDRDKYEFKSIKSK